jgi:hypothetical protein
MLTLDGRISGRLLGVLSSSYMLFDWCEKTRKDIAVKKTVSFQIHAHP